MKGGAKSLMLRFSGSVHPCPSLPAPHQQGQLHCAVQGRCVASQSMRGRANSVQASPVCPQTGAAEGPQSQTSPWPRVASRPLTLARSSPASPLQICFSLQDTNHSVFLLHTTYLFVIIVQISPNRCAGLLQLSLNRQNAILTNTVSYLFFKRYFSAATSLVCGQSDFSRH